MVTKVSFRIAKKGGVVNKVSFSMAGKGRGIFFLHGLIGRAQISKFQHGSKGTWPKK
jgi:hypothetical protein